MTTLRSFYCPSCSTPIGDGKRRHPKLELGDHEGFGDYYPATCPSCNTVHEIPADQAETT